MTGWAKRDEIRLLVVILVVIDMMHVQVLADLFLGHMAKTTRITVSLPNLRRNLSKVR